MNAKQALKAVTDRNLELEDYNRRASADIKAYNRVISGTIEGKSICPWCDDYQECQLSAKDGKGCDLWMLKDLHEGLTIAPDGEPDQLPGQLMIEGADGNAD